MKTTFMRKPFGLSLLIAGILLLVWGSTSAFMADAADRGLWLLAGGVLTTLVGGGLAFIPDRGLR